jgi:hypothetical protein
MSWFNALSLTGIVCLGACGSLFPPARYIVTAVPVDVGTGGFGLCIAVDPADHAGIWWWQPGPSGCATRTTGPTVFHADAASVTRSAGTTGGTQVINARFVVQLHRGSRDITLLLHDSTMDVVSVNRQVATVRRKDLEIPPAYGG